MKNKQNEKTNKMKKQTIEEIANHYETDKRASDHNYTEYYEQYFEAIRDKELNVVEIGILRHPARPYEGASLLLWRDYFENSIIHGIDINDHRSMEQQRIKIHIADQGDRTQLDNVFNGIGNSDIIIDDGSHINGHVIKSFEFLFPRLKTGGIYIIEDTQTSYWEEYGGTSTDFNRAGTIYHYFKSLIDCLNNVEFIIGDYKKSYFDKHIIGMHFYHNMIFIYKGDNNELSNKVRNNQFK